MTARLSTYLQDQMKNNDDLGVHQREVNMESTEAGIWFNRGLDATPHSMRLVRFCSNVGNCLMRPT